MLQRAATNAYSWWWASHIRTKQSKWLEQNLQDMEEKVQYMLTLIEEDGDSFAKRAEMYYKRRPELVHFVEDSYRAYRALAERYDHISKELQSANNTIASVFPEQVQFSIDEEDEEASLKFPKRPPELPKTSIPKVPKAPVELKKLQSNKTFKSSNLIVVPKSGMSKSEALDEIDKLQKQVLTLQTEKEFVKSSYENGVAKYWEIEKRVKEMQERVFCLQDEFGEGMLIEDDEARSLMATTALKSSQETLFQLQEKQDRLAEEANIEIKRITNARVKLESLKKFQSANKEPLKVNDEADIEEEGSRESELSVKKVREQFQLNKSMTVTEMAEMIDELVNKVISLESEVQSQTALVKRVRTETDELHAQIRTMEDNKEILINSENYSINKPSEMEEKLNGIQNLNWRFENQTNNLPTDSADVLFNPDYLSDRLPSVKPGEETGSLVCVELFSGEAGSPKEFNQPDNGINELVVVMPDEKLYAASAGQKEEFFVDIEFPTEIKEQEDLLNFGDSSDKADAIGSTGNQVEDGDTREKNIAGKNSSQTISDLPHSKQDEQDRELEDEPNWQQLFTNGLEGRERILLTEYTTTLRNYRDVKKKLSEVESKNQDSLKELKNSNAVKDEEIKSLRQKLILMQKCFYENKDSRDLQASDYLQTSNSLKDRNSESKEEEENDDINVFLIEKPATTSAIEEKFRMNIDELLEENLDFWLNFSTSFHEIEKFETEIQDLQAEASKLEEKGKVSGSGSANYSLKSDARPIYKHLIELQTELTVWLEKSELLKEELQFRFTSLCNIQEEITAALRASAEDDDFKFTSYQAAKFQGEVLNMKQENNKVADELQAGLEYINTLQVEVEKTLEKLNEEFQLSGSKKQQSAQPRDSERRNRVPLHSFIFGVKQKKQKPSIFSYVAPAMHRKYHGSRAGPPP